MRPLRSTTSRRALSNSVCGTMFFAASGSSMSTLRWASARLPRRLLIVACASPTSRRRWSADAFKRRDLAAQCRLTHRLQRRLAFAIAAGAGRRSAQAFGPEPRRTRRQRARLGFDLAKLGRALRVVEPREQLPALDPLARANDEFADRRRLGRLDQLDLARRDDLALPAGHFVDLRQHRPQQEQHERRSPKRR